MCIRDRYVPSIIAKMLPSWGKGSSVGVTYNYQNTPSDYVLEYRTVTNKMCIRDSLEQILVHLNRRYLIIIFVRCV